MGVRKAQQKVLVCTGFCPLVNHLNRGIEESLWRPVASHTWAADNRQQRRMQTELLPLVTTLQNRPHQAVNGAEQFDAGPRTPTNVREASNLQGWMQFCYKILARRCPTTECLLKIWIVSPRRLKFRLASNRTLADRRDLKLTNGLAVTFAP